MEDEDGSRLKATTSQIYQCLSTHKPSPGIPSAQGFHKWKDILVPVWTKEKSSRNLFVGKYKIVTACQFYFVRGKKKSFLFLLLLACLKIPSIQSRALQMAKKVYRNATVTSSCTCGQERMKTLFPSPEASITTKSQSQPRHLQFVECLLHSLLSEIPPHYRILAKVK